MKFGIGMEGKFVKYDYLTSFQRIDSKIATSDNSFLERDYIPSRTELTFSNGFYVKCTAMFVDIRDSSKLPNIHTRPKLAKLFRAFISEVIAVIIGNENCAEVNVEGDCIIGIFNTPKKSQIDSVFGTAYTITSLIDVMNYKFKKYDISSIKIGIGLSWGRALMIKAGFKGSGINDVVWMGDVLNEASMLSDYGNKTSSDKDIMVSRVFYGNLNDANKKLLSWNESRRCYHGNVGNTAMIAWYKKNCT